MSIAPTLTDRGEDVGRMEPLLLRQAAPGRDELVDAVMTLASRSASLRSSLPAAIVDGIAKLVRSMNCYYSNLIEGHDTHPVEIERALAADFSADPKQRDLQREATAHIAVQAWIDGGGLVGRSLTVDGVCEIHRRFCERLPADLLVVEDPNTGERHPVVGGALRTRDVKVGRHLAISPGAVPRFLTRFEQAYARLGTTERVLVSAAAHHRLLWIHPFLDGNGRVARLMSHALLLDTLQTGGLWSVARGLARQERDYKRWLAACDLRRRNDLDGRGNLSEEELVGFTRFFLETCIDQVDFMRTLLQPDALHGRIIRWAQEESAAGALPGNAATVLQAVLFRGELPRGEVGALLGTTGRHARRTVSALIGVGALTAEGPRAPLRLAFPATLAGRWMPGLFPER